MPYDYEFCAKNGSDCRVFKLGEYTTDVAVCDTLDQAERVVEALNLLEDRENLDGLGR